MTDTSGCYAYSAASSYDCSYSYAATGTTTYTYSVKVNKLTAGALSTLVTFTTTFEPRSLKVTSSNNVITIIAYSAIGQTGTASTFTYTATSPARTAYAGMAAIPASSNQGTTFDNFSLK